MPNYNQLFNQQAQFQNQLLNNFNQLSNQFLTAFTGGNGQQQQRPPPFGQNQGSQHNHGHTQRPITHRPTYPHVPTNRPQPPQPPTPEPVDNTDELINEIFTRPSPDDESGADLIDIRVDENEEKTRRRRDAPETSEQEVGVDNRFGFGELLFLVLYENAIRNNHKILRNFFLKSRRNYLLHS